MLQIAITIFPVIAIALGVVSLVSVVRFVARIYRESRGEAMASRPE